VTREDIKPSPQELAAKQEADQEAERVRAEAETRRAEAIDAAKWRDWTTKDAKYTVKAKFVKAAQGVGTFEKEDGKVVDVKLELLSLEDQDFIKYRKWQRVVE
jgi:hypothetical protein